MIRNATLKSPTLKILTLSSSILKIVYQIVVLVTMCSQQLDIHTLDKNVVVFKNKQ